MELIRGLHNLRPEHRGCVATIGNFDGVHLGHQAVIGQLADEGRDYGVPSLVMTFEPQPLEYFQPNKAPARLTRLREKLRQLGRFAVDRVLVCEFDEKFASLDAEDFVERILVEGLGVRHLVVGDDFQFGKARRGDFAMLQQAGRRFGFDVVHMHTFNIDGERVSSTRIRTALAIGDLQTAEKLLGRPYRMCGRVAHGDKIGRTLGIPTANIHLHRNMSPVQGIYVVEVFGVRGEPVQGVASVGTRPTVGGTRALLEIHLFDFNEQIYGQYLNIDFLHKLRDEEKFDSLDEMKLRIFQDIDEARTWFANRT
ncbi:MAG: bifunctional riboflavin kinase/FAD synthetase [Gammaproteobacteria bacterium]|nr:bifunctional riboflavin kinase/FAD synthetase [Gammaproteobacteria bacterium]